VADWIWTIVVNQFKPYLQKYKNKKFNDHSFCSLNDWWGKRKVRLRRLWQHANIKTKSTFFHTFSHFQNVTHKNQMQFANFTPSLHTQAQNVMGSTSARSELLTVVADDSNLLGHYTMSTAKQLPMFQRIIVPSSSVFYDEDTVVLKDVSNY